MFFVKGTEGNTRSLQYYTMYIVYKIWYNLEIDCKSIQFKGNHLLIFLCN